MIFDNLFWEEFTTVENLQVLRPMSVLCINIVLIREGENKFPSVAILFYTISEKVFIKRVAYFSKV
jgi:hypothetical protein